MISSMISEGILPFRRRTVNPFSLPAGGLGEWPRQAQVRLLALQAAARAEDIVKRPRSLHQETKVSAPRDQDLRTKRPRSLGSEMPMRAVLPVVCARIPGGATPSRARERIPARARETLSPSSRPGGRARGPFARKRKIHGGTPQKTENMIKYVSTFHLRGAIDGYED